MAVFNSKWKYENLAAVALSVFRRRRRTWSFRVAVLQRTAKKCTKIYNARVWLSFCSLDFLFGDFLVAGSRLGDLLKLLIAYKLLIKKNVPRKLTSPQNEPLQKCSSR